MNICLNVVERIQPLHTLNMQPELELLINVVLHKNYMGVAFFRPLIKTLDSIPFKGFKYSTNYSSFYFTGDYEPIKAWIKAEFKFGLDQSWYRVVETQKEVSKILESLPRFCQSHCSITNINQLFQ